MPTPGQPERGERSPFVLRFGISTPGCIGIYKEPDPGAIPNNALQDGINVRIDAADLVERGGQTKANTVAMNGCIYGMIDVSGGIGVLFWDQAGDFNEGRTGTGWTGGSGDEGLHTFNPISNTVTPFVADLAAISPSVISMVDSATPRRVFVYFQGKLYIYGTGSLGAGLYAASFDGDVPSTGGLKVTIGVLVADLCSFTVRKEVTPNGLNEALYMGTTAGGLIYRWDGSSFTQEASAVGSERLIMFVFAGEVCAAYTGGIAKRNGGTWNVTVAAPTGTFRPSSALEISTLAYITGNDGFGDDRARVITFNGTSTAVLFPATGQVLDVGDIVARDGNIYVSYGGKFLGGSGAPPQLCGVMVYDGVSWSSLFEFEHETSVVTGALVGTDDLFWFGAGLTNSKEGAYLHRFFQYVGSPIYLGGDADNLTSIANPADAIAIG